MSTAKRENPTSFTNDLEITLYLKLDLLQESIHKIFKKKNVANSAIPIFSQPPSILNYF